MRHRFHDRLFWFSCISIAFFLPVFGRIVPLIIVVLVLNWLIDNGVNKRFLTSAVLGIMIVFLAVMIFLLSSKAGIPALGIVIILSALYSWKRLNSGWTGIVILVCGLVLFIVSYLVAPVAFSRISEAGHTAASPPSQENLTPEDKADRIALWTTALEIIKKNF